MRTLDPAFQSALDSGQFDPYFRVSISDRYSLLQLLYTQPIGYKLDELTLSFTIQTDVYLDYPFFRTGIRLERGITLGDDVLTVATSDFYIVNTIWDGNFQTFNCHLVPEAHFSAQGDYTYHAVIDGFCSTFGLTALYLEPAADWLDFQFLPTGKTLTLNNAQQFFTLIRQKYFIFACDWGENQILFYTPFTHVADPLYHVDGYHYDVDYSVFHRRQYLWRDELDTTHLTEPSFELHATPDATVDTILSMLDLGSGRLLAGGKKTNHAPIFRSTDYGLTWSSYDTSALGGFHTNILSLITPAPGVILACGNYPGFILRSTDYGFSWSEVLTADMDTIQVLTDCGEGVILAAYIQPAGTARVRFYRSEDFGLTWSDLGTDLHWLAAYASGVYSLISLGNGVVLAGTRPNGRVFRSEDNGDTWEYAEVLDTETGVYSLLALGGGRVAAGTYPAAKVFISEDDGQTWTMKVDFDAPDTFVYSLVTLGGGVILAGTGPGGNVYRSLDNGENWEYVQQLGSEKEVRAFLALSNGMVLASTNDHGQIYHSLNCGASLDLIHNLGFMPSTAHEPTAYFQLAPPKFDRFPLNLKYQCTDYIRIDLPTGGTYDLLCASVTEVLDLSKKSMAWYMELTETPWLSNTAVGALPGTIERVAAYTPLVTSSFGKNMTAAQNNLQAFADCFDDYSPVLINEDPPTVNIQGKDFVWCTDDSTLYIWQGMDWAAVAGGGGSGDISGSGTAGQLTQFSAVKTITSAKLIAPTDNILTLKSTSAASLELALTAGKTLTLTATDNYNLTVPQSGTAALLEAGNVFTSVNRIEVTLTTIPEVEDYSFLGVYGTIANTDDLDVGIGNIFRVTASPAAGKTLSWANALMGKIIYTSGSIDTFTALTGFVSGHDAEISSAYAITAGLDAESGTIESFFGIYVFAGSGPTITNNYGLFIDDFGIGTELNYAIYTNAGTVHFGDSIEQVSNINIAGSIWSVNFAPSSLVSSGGNIFGVTSLPASITLASGKYYDGIVSSLNNVTVSSGTASLYMFYASQPTGSVTGTLATLAGVYVDDMNKASTNYAIYTKAGTVHFGDSVELASGKNLTLAAGNIITDTTTGTQIATAITQKIAFYGKTPIVQRSGSAQAAAPAGGTGATAGAYDTATHRNTMITLVNEMRDTLIALGLFKGSA
jgi:hypothetical protein